MHAIHNVVLLAEEYVATSLSGVLYSATDYDEISIGNHMDSSAIWE